MNDVYKVLSNLFEPNGVVDVDYFGNNDEVNLLGWIIENYPQVDFEYPDAYYITNDTILIMEHFRYDCYKNTKKGSLALMEKIILMPNLIKCWILILRIVLI